MKVTKKHIAYFTILAIGGGWLAIDNLPGSNTHGSAARAAMVAHAPAASNAAPVAIAADVGDEPAIAQRLSDLSQSRKLDSKPTIDGFALPAAFQPSAQTAARLIPAATAATTFISKHTLTSVMVGGRASSALVDNKTFLKVGDQCDGFTLTAVTNNTAVFTGARGTNAVLQFPKPGNATASVQGP